LAAAREFGTVDAAQPPFSIIARRAADDLLPYCQEHRIAVLPYGPLAKGLLAGKFGPDSVFSDNRARDPAFVGRRYRRNLRLVECLKETAGHYCKSVAQLAIQWVLAHPGVTAAIVGAKRPSQVVENVGGAGWSLTEEDRARIDRLLEAHEREG
jgi:aryl-alcohol dehydrogenase-like predicted oxidoreductase